MARKKNREMNGINQKIWKQILPYIITYYIKVKILNLEENNEVINK